MGGWGQFSARVDPGMAPASPLGDRSHRASLIPAERRARSSGVRGLRWPRAARGTAPALPPTPKADRSFRSLHDVGALDGAKDAFLPRLKVPASALRAKPPPCGPCFSRAAKAAEASEALLESLYARLRARDWHFAEVRFRFLRRAQLSQFEGFCVEEWAHFDCEEGSSFHPSLQLSPCGPYFSRVAKA